VERRPLWLTVLCHSRCELHALQQRLEETQGQSRIDLYFYLLKICKVDADSAATNTSCRLSEKFKGTSSASILNPALFLTGLFVPYDRLQGSDPGSRPVYRLSTVVTLARRLINTRCQLSDFAAFFLPRHLPCSPQEKSFYYGGVNHNDRSKWRSRGT